MGLLKVLARFGTNATSVSASLDDRIASARFDSGGAIVEANAAFHALFDCPEHSLVGARYDELIKSDSTGRTAPLKETFWASLSEAPSWGRVDACNRSGRPMRLAIVHLRPFQETEPNGDLIVLATDVTAEEHYGARDKSLVQAVERTALMVEFDRQGTVIYANDLFLAAIERTLDTVVGEPHRNFVDPAEAISRGYEEFWDDLRAGVPKNGTFRRFTRTGKAIWMEATYTPILDAFGVVTGVLKIAFDVTEKKLAALNNEAQSAAMNRSTAMIEFKPDGTILSANDLFLGLMGYQMREISGRHHRIFVTPEDAASPDYTAFWQKLHRGDFDAGEYRRIAKDGRDVWISASYNPIFGADGSVAKVVKFATDITGRRAAIDTMKSVLSRLAAGDLTARVTMDLSPEFDALRTDFNAAADALSTLLSDIVERTGSALSKISEIAQSADSLSRRTEQQAATLEETAAAMQEISASVKSSSGAADGASQLVALSRVRTEAGVQVVRDAVEAMQDLAQKSGQISSITRVIDDIAFQTNLLALNAGVEAARAGDAGRGFAVVASEVRALAQRSSDAAREIANLIAASTTQVDRCVNLVSQGGVALGEIETSVREISTRIVEIASSAREQSVGFGEINVAISQLDSFTQQNAAMFEETSAATRLLTNEITALSGATESFQCNVDPSAGLGVGRSHSGRDGREPISRAG